MCSSHGSSRVLFLPKSYLYEPDHKILPFCPWLLSWPTGLLPSEPPAFFFNPKSLLIALHLSCLMWLTSMYAFVVFTSSALNVSTSGLSLIVTSDPPSPSGTLGFRTLRVPVPQCNSPTSNARFLSTLMKSACRPRDLLCFLCRGLSQCSVGDRLHPLADSPATSRIDQISAQALRYRMRFEDLHLLKIFTCLHDQKPVRLPPVVLFSTNCAPPLCGFSGRDPPHEVFQRETVAVWAQVRHCDSSLSANGLNDSPQVVRTSEHDLLHNAHLFLFYPVEGPF